MIQSFHGLDLSLSSDMKIDLFLSNNKIVIFPEQRKKSHHSKHIKGLKLYPILILEAVIYSASSQIHFD